MDQTLLSFLAVLTVMGIMAASSCGYRISIMFSDKQFPVLMYACAAIIFMISMTVDFGFILLESIPRNNGDRFRFHWKFYLRQRFDKQCLKSCPAIGYSVGLIKKVNLYTALSIADTILNLTATMALAKVNANK